MTSLRYTGIPTSAARPMQLGGVDAYDNLPEKFVCDSNDLECRHCGQHIEIGEGALLVAWSPFPDRQVFAETGPIILHGKPCESYISQPSPPQTILAPAARLVRGYSHDNRIVYATGQVVDRERIDAACRKILEDDRVNYVHIRSSTNNCWQARVEIA